jgi:hypothetical protein
MRLPDDWLDRSSIAIGPFDRLELSYPHLSFDAGSKGGTLRLGNRVTFGLDMFTAKLCLFGDAVRDQDRGARDWRSACSKRRKVPTWCCAPTAPAGRATSTSASRP